MTGEISYAYSGNSCIMTLLIASCWPGAGGGGVGGGEASMSEHQLSIFLKNVKVELTLSQPSFMSCWAGKGNGKMSAVGSE